MTKYLVSNEAWWKWWESIHKYGLCRAAGILWGGGCPVCEWEWEQYQTEMWQDELRSLEEKEYGNT